MKLRHIFINVLPLPLWLGYYVLIVGTNRNLFIQPEEDMLLAIVAIVFVVYNCYSTKIYEAVIRNSVFALSYAAACYISGQVYLKYFPHMSDDHDVVPSIAMEFAMYAVVVVLIGCLVKCIAAFIKERKEKETPQKI